MSLGLKLCIASELTDWVERVATYIRLEGFYCYADGYQEGIPSVASGYHGGYGKGIDTNVDDTLIRARFFVMGWGVGGITGDKYFSSSSGGDGYVYE